jgi:hypothetical protein
MVQPWAAPTCHYDPTSLPISPLPHGPTSAPTIVCRPRWPRAGADAGQNTSQLCHRSLGKVAFGSESRIQLRGCFSDSRGWKACCERRTSQRPFARVLTVETQLNSLLKRGLCVGKTKRGKGSKIMVPVDGRGLPLGAEIASASPHEVTLIESLLERRILPTSPRRLIYDRAADSDPLRARLAKRGIELVCPHRENRNKPPTQDGRKLRRYRRRWKIERSIGWL